MTATVRVSFFRRCMYLYYSDVFYLPDGCLKAAAVVMALQSEMHYKLRVAFTTF